MVNDNDTENNDTQTQILNTEQAIQKTEDSIHDKTHQGCDLSDDRCTAFGC